MKKPKSFTVEEVLADIKFLLEQSYIIEHKQDYDGICRLRKKYGVNL